MTKIITVGSATIDLYFQDDQLPEEKNRLSLSYGGKYTAENFVLSTGGGATNSAVSLSRLGFEVFCWTQVGKDWMGKTIIQNLKKEKVNTNLVNHSSKETTISAILLGKTRERTIITYRAKNDLLDFTPQVKEVIKSCQWFYFSNLTLCPKEIKIKWLQFAQENGVKTFVTLSGHEFKKGRGYLDDFFVLSNIFILNAHELADIWGGNAPDLDLKKVNYAQKLNLPFLVVTYDVNGSYAYTKEKIYYQPVVKPKVIADTTGAGDAYGSGFLGQYIKTGDIQKAMEFGSRNASSVIEHISTQKGLLFNQ